MTHEDTPSALIDRAKDLLDRAGAVYKIWTIDDVRSEAEEIYDDATESELDTIASEAWPVIDLANCTDRDWQLIGDAISEAVLRKN